MLISLTKKIEKCGALEFVLLFTVLAEILTAFLNTLLSRIFWGKISPDLLVIGSVDALIVSLVVSSIGIYLIKKNANLMAMNQRLLDEMKGREQAEEALQLARFTVEKAGDAVYWLDSKARIIDVNETACNMLGYSREDLLKLTVFDIDPDFSAEQWTKAWEAVRIKGKNTIETRHRTRDGRIIPVEIMANYLNLGGMELDCAFARDISERRQIEETLRKSESRYRAIVENQAEFVVRYMSGGILTYINDTFCRYLKTERADLIGKSYYTYIHAEDRAAFIRQIEYLGVNNPSMVAEARVVLMDGRVTWHKWTHSAIFDKGNNIVEYQATGRDITAGKMAKEALRQSEEKYKFLVETTNTGFVIIDSIGHVVDANQEYARLTGHETPDEILGRSVVEWTAEYDLERNVEEVRKCAETGHVRNLLIDYVSRDGRITPVEINADVMHFDDSVRIYTLCRDISERRFLEEEHLKNQKLESLGILAGGLAHDFNNLLMGIMGNLSVAKMYVEEKGKVYERLEEAEKASERARELTRQLLTFASGGEPVKEVASVVKVVKEMSKFALLGSNVACKLSVDDDIWSAYMDSGQISQVINNLIINAKQAMPEGGSIDISCENLIVERETALPLREGKYIKISMRDSGIGIPREYLAKIFDPYFTTKEKGRGLGLASCYSIMKKHQGHIEVASEAGRGATFTLYLPAMEKKPVEQESRQVGLRKRQGRIMVMDDEQMVRDVVGEMLKKLGYKVCLTKDGREAIEKFEEARAGGEPFDAVIMDLTIPGGMGGREAVKELLRIDPQVKAIVSSGYANDPITANYREYGFIEVLAKPYKMEHLDSIVEKVLSSQS